MQDLEKDVQADIEAVGRIEAVPTILDVVCRTTGMRFAAVARVTADRWIACGVLDEINFGLKPGGELKIETTICNEIRECREAVIIDHVAEDEGWRNHPTPQMYGFQSYISMPIILGDGSFFGTLCAIDPRPARLNTPETIGMFRLFAELIAKHLDAGKKLADTESKLMEEQETGGLREQFIAVLAHDLRSPARAVNSLSELLLESPLDERSKKMTRLIKDSASRMVGLIDNMLDLAHSRLAGGLSVTRDSHEPLEPVLRTVIAEVTANHPGRSVELEVKLTEPINCDRARIAQLISNLVVNALTYGATDKPVKVRASNDAKAFELTVSNAGDPIPPAALGHLFQPFYRSTVLRSREGLGLGLYIAYEIATAHGGTLEVQSTAQETCFTLRMPQV